MPKDKDLTSELETVLGAILTAAETYDTHPALLYNTVLHHVLKYARPEQKQPIVDNMRTAAKRYDP